MRPSIARPAIAFVIASGERVQALLSNACGVGQLANCTACSFSGRLLRSIVSALARPSRQSRAAGVAHEAACFSDAPPSRLGHSCGPVPSFARGVGQEAIIAASCRLLRPVSIRSA